jgi:micrococcal nuclease
MARRGNNVVPIRSQRRGRGAGDLGARGKPWWRRVSPITVMLPLATFTAVFVLGPPEATPLPLDTPPAGGADREEARFGLCGGMGRASGNCVIDGDTFWYRGEKIRIADINTPETSDPECAAEARLGAAATGRLRVLLNDGAFTLEQVGRDRDRYGRLLRTVTRGGESLGSVLVKEGLAEEWRGYRGSWC